ncbi:hypothetical protein TNCV_4011 [Trichonephila clavipes]|nr:hypothetical protein TNCV_4011 [Trichonephila clavipes]
MTFQRQCVGRSYPQSFDRVISSVKASGRQDVCGIPTRGVFILLQSLPANINTRIWFRHDGAPTYFSADVQITLDTAYPGRWIGRGSTPTRPWLRGLPLY